MCRGETPDSGVFSPVEEMSMSVQMVIELRDRESAQTVIQALDAYEIHKKFPRKPNKHHAEARGVAA